ncbi:MAG: hypothetical protein GFH27_549305n33 [Chloroflexi bacterium AL-W]|nr:hypothetical protein [Chloroflexi bacterium AL-N1]NOK69279.1 hypothetical protein [Chloroflexi bacterium AL-N10]NOK76340.1 hypothetical protein [Chloroflexi bacterium AL-N5]NOK83457.1 hypothetical protein [Chloroflexi bacterium AL-W]NOK91117.1 hypothetical protein [Chloroflexi bacterium AL-N15]
MIMSGTREARIHQLQLIDIHGTRFYDLNYAHDDNPTQLLKARIGIESIYEDPHPDDAVTIQYLMNVPVNVTRR